MKEGRRDREREGEEGEGKGKNRYKQVIIHHSIEPFFSKMASTSCRHFSWCSGCLARLYMVHAKPEGCASSQHARTLQLA